MNNDVLFWLCLYFGVIVNELLHVSRNQRKIKTVEQYIKTRWDDLLIALITAFPIGLGADWIFEQIKMSGMNAYIGAFALGLAAVILLNFAVKYTKQIGKSDPAAKE